MLYEELIQNIENLSAQKGINKTTAFVESGVGKNFIFNIQRGSKPSIEKIQMLATYFNVSTDYLLGNDTSNVKDPATKDEIKFALFNGSEGVTDEMYDEVKKFADFVKQREQQKGKK